MIDTLRLSTSPVWTFKGRRRLTQASAFFFAREGRLFLVTSRHVLFDACNAHAPDRLEIVLPALGDHARPSIRLVIALYCKGKGVWRQGTGSTRDVDVAVIEIDQSGLAQTNLCAFTPEHLQLNRRELEVGYPLVIVGFPQGLHNERHHLPVVRHAVIASSFGLQSQGPGMFMTDARMHGGSSGSPVVSRARATEAACRYLPWKLLGVHSSLLNVGAAACDGPRDASLGLNVAWYADALMELTVASDAVLAPRSLHANQKPRHTMIAV